MYIATLGQYTYFAGMFVLHLQKISQVLAALAMFSC